MRCAFVLHLSFSLWLEECPWKTKKKKKWTANWYSCALACFILNKSRWWAVTSPQRMFVALIGTFYPFSGENDQPPIPEFTHAFSLQAVKTTAAELFHPAAADGAHSLFSPCVFFFFLFDIICICFDISPPRWTRKTQRPVLLPLSLSLCVTCRLLTISNNAVNCILQLTHTHTQRASCLTLRVCGRESA